MSIARCILIVWVVAASPSAAAATLAEKVSAARAAVDSLADQLESQRRADRDALAGLRAERSELQRQIRLEEIRRDTLATLRAERTQKIDDQESRVLAILKPIQRSIAATKNYVTQTLPFKRAERLRSLEQIETDITVTNPDSAQALTRLWRFIEEESSMAREVALAQQAIELDGKRYLADIARVGMALMYFRLPDGTLGWVHQIENQWKFQRLENMQAQNTVAGIFKDLENNRVLGPKQLLLPTDMPNEVNRNASP